VSSPVRSRILIENVWPSISCGRFPVKRTRGEPVEVWADVIRDGHEQLGAAVLYRAPRETGWREAPMEHFAADRWSGSVVPDELGRWSFAVCAWVDRYESWREEVRRKVEAGQADLSSELAEGAVLMGFPALDVESALATTVQDRSEQTRSEAFEVDVDRELAAFGAWYELFPRSWGGFKGVEAVLSELAKLGFDVVYFPPIHPIGRTNRKGRDNALEAGPGDPGSPWAIGSDEGGHTAIHPELGTLAEFDRLVGRARSLGLEIALDFAIQCSPDHPWLREHPEWFHRRPDGTLKYAENPPKRYQDIYNLNFESEDREGLWNALLAVVHFWVGHGVRIFRVDNPHTKPLPFWEWLIREVRERFPDVVFLSEAFTRPRLMEALAKLGFSQSYTYFTWRNAKAELVEYMTQLTRSDLPQYFRPNFFANTPDILHEYLQRGGPPAFEARLVLAATLSPSYGIYSGFEHFENVPVREGSEEYLSSEKYEVRRRRLDGLLLPLVGRLNAIRREHPVFRRIANIEFLETEQDALLAYLKREDGDWVVVCVNLDPFAEHDGVVVLPAALGLPPSSAVVDLLDGRRYQWRIGRNYVRLGPGKSHVMGPAR
jgi:starch synthase (maltosyl-transferring)